MIKFKSIQDALAYRPFCPICYERMEVDNKYGAQVRREYDSEEKITLIWKSNQDELIINLNNDRVESLTKKVRSSAIFGLPGQIIGFEYTPVENGIMYTSLAVGCEGCFQYSYVVQILVDISRKMIDSVILNSELISVEDKETLHEIRNVYTTDKTEYSWFKTGQSEGEPVDEKSIILPLVPLDLSCPEKTVERIRNLILFS